MNRLLAAVLLTVSAVTPLYAQDTISLPLRDAVRMALEKNLDLRVELYNPAQSEAELRKARGIYDPHLTADTSYLYSNTYSLTLGGASSNRTFKVTPGAHQLLPSGGTVSAQFGNTYTSADLPVVGSSSWQSDLTLALTQPLLKNFGRDATETSILVAVQGKEGSLQRYRQLVLNTVAQVQSEYYQLRSQRETLESRKVSLELSRRILADTKARVAAGVLPAMEILNAEFGVASREKDLIDAERAVRDREDTLRRLIQADPDREILPIDPPSRVELIRQETEAIDRALALRPEFADLQAQLLTAELQERLAKNRTQPDLNLATSLALTGAGDGYGRDMDRLGSAKYPVWSVGLQFDYPLGNRAAENDYVKSRLRTEQIRVQQANLRTEVANAVRSSLRGVQTSFKQLDVSDRSRAYAEERLKAYIKKHEVGLATTKEVLDVENELSAARSNQIAAQVAYGTAVIQLLAATGELLEREGIVVTAAAADNLLENRR